MANSTIGYTAKKLIAIAEAEVGYLEKASNSDLDSKTANAGYNNWTKYARDLYKVAFSLDTAASARSIRPSR